MCTMGNINRLLTLTDKGSKNGTISSFNLGSIDSGIDDIFSPAINCMCLQITIIACVFRSPVAERSAVSK